jgi:DNA-binding GntR family transcriptional regulator
MNEPLLRTMSGQIVTRIRDKILMGVYAPGSALLQDSIAAEFGVSKIPVREALVRLRAEGLIDIHAHRGFQVRGLSAKEVAEVFKLRLKLEPAAVAEGARLSSPPDHAAARQALTRYNDALSAKNLADVGNLNCAFHLALIVPHAQPVTFEVLSRLHLLSQRYVQLHLLPAGRARRAIREHEELFGVWSKGKGKEASRLTQSHIEETRAELVVALKRLNF